jgi:phage-related protein
VERQYEDFLFSLLKPEEQYASSESFKPITEKAGVVYLKESLIELARFQERTKAVLDYKLEQLERSKRRSEKKKFDIIEESEKAIKRSWTRCLTPLLPRGIIWKQS